MMDDFVAGWVQRLLTGLREQVDGDTRARVLAGCSHVCTASWAAFCAVLPGGGPDVRVEGDTIFWSFAPGDCPCPIGQLTKSPEVCLCGAGHVRGMLEPLLGRSLIVQSERSRLRGDGECTYTIRWER